MLIERKIIHELGMLTRRKDVSKIIPIYEEAKNAILEIEEHDGIKNGYFSKEAQLNRQIKDEYKDLVSIKQKELDELKTQIEKSKAIENQFAELNKSLVNLEKTSKEKDSIIKKLETKIKKVEAKAAN